MRRVSPGLAVCVICLALLGYFAGAAAYVVQYRVMH